MTGFTATTMHPKPSPQRGYGKRFIDSARKWRLCLHPSGCRAPLSADAGNSTSIYALGFVAGNVWNKWPTLTPSSWNVLRIRCNVSSADDWYDGYWFWALITRLTVQCNTKGSQFHFYHRTEILTQKPMIMKRLIYPLCCWWRRRHGLNRNRPRSRYGIPPSRYLLLSTGQSPTRSHCQSNTKAIEAKANVLKKLYEDYQNPPTLLLRKPAKREAIVAKEEKKRRKLTKIFSGPKVNGWRNVDFSNSGCHLNAGKKEIASTDTMP